jgi:hypothetical protein
MPFDSLKKLGGRKPKSPLERFEASYMPEPNTGCWLWLGCERGSNGYGGIKVGNKAVAAHRFSYEQFIGSIPQNMVVCHRCDTPACVNPAHLFVGTIQDNEDDKKRKNRHSHGEKHRKSLAHVKRWGEFSPTAKLTMKQVIQIRADNRPQRVVARDHGVSQTTIHNIRSNITWRNYRA